MHLHMLGAGDTTLQTVAPTPIRLTETNAVSMGLGSISISTSVPAGRFLTLGARRLFDLLKFYGRGSLGAVPKQSTLAAKLKCHERTVRKWLAELAAFGLPILVTKRGRTSARYSIPLIPCGNLAAEGRSGAGLGPVEEALSITEVTAETQNKAAPLKPSVENQKQRQGRQAWEPIALPEPTVTNEYGRTDPNPNYLAVVSALRLARSRIASARDPGRYEQAIIRAEMVRLGLLQNADNPAMLRKPAAFELAWPDSRRLKA